MLNARRVIAITESNNNVALVFVCVCAESESKSWWYNNCNIMIHPLSYIEVRGGERDKLTRVAMAVVLNN